MAAVRRRAIALAQIARDGPGPVLRAHAQLGSSGQHRMRGDDLALVTDDEVATLAHDFDRLTNEPERH